MSDTDFATDSGVSGGYASPFAQIFMRLALGGDPNDLDPGLQPMARNVALLLPQQPPLGPGLLGDANLGQTEGDAFGADQAVDKSAGVGPDDEGSTDDGGEIQQAADAKPPPYPNDWDALIERRVAEDNQRRGFKLGDVEYLDPDVFKALVRQETQFNRNAYNDDPVQVNHRGDWAPEKRRYGLKEGVAPGPDLSITAGIGWLRRKSRSADGRGEFLGWPRAVQSYNGSGNPDYLKQFSQRLLELKRQER